MKQLHAYCDKCAQFTQSMFVNVIFWIKSLLRQSAEDEEERLHVRLRVIPETLGILGIVGITNKAGDKLRCFLVRACIFDCRKRINAGKNMIAVASSKG